jgi:hypothetical protein
MQKIKVRCIKSEKEIVNLDDNTLLYFYRFTTTVKKDEIKPPLGAELTIQSNAPQHFKEGAEYELGITADAGLVVAQSVQEVK